MINLAKLILKILPWLLTVGLLSWMLLQEKMNFSKERVTKIETNTILTRVEQMGKMELVKYNFQEVTEVKKIANEIDLKIFKYKPIPDSKAVLISQGSAVGCIDFAKIKPEDISIENDTVYLSLPAPEICYFKIDLEKSRLYDLQIDYMRQDERKNFIQELYKVAEQEIKNSSIQSGILEQTRENAHAVLRPMLEGISGRVVILSFRMDEPIIKEPGL
ncbi:MAG: DUF4230 domain-containing protein [Ekhidna sp.]|uniref:DUF4230 domain-containing protein n=1 Tax=Ekhidna sp. TaxID=2608089 RepID=UPI0032EEADF5